MGKDLQGLDDEVREGRSQIVISDVMAFLTTSRICTKANEINYNRNA